MDATANRTSLYHVRWMVRRDIPAVLKIEEASFSCCWTEEEFHRVMSKQDMIGMIAEPRDASGFDHTLGFVIYQLRRKLLPVLNLAVDPAYRRRGVGTALVAKLVSKLEPHRRRALVLDLGERNLNAQLFFKHRGFRATGMVRGRYDDADDDGIRMVYRLGKAVGPADEPIILDHAHGVPRGPHAGRLGPMGGG